MSQASHEFRGSVDFNQNELRNATFQRLITPPIGPVDGQIYYSSINNIPYYWDSSKWRPFGIKPVHIKYNSLLAMFAGQVNQLEGYIYHDTDKNKYYEYLGTTVGDITDYNPLTGEERNNRVDVLYIDPNELSGIGTEPEQICEYLNANKTVDYSRQTSKLNIIIGINPYENDSFTYLFQFLLS